MSRALAGGSPVTALAAFHDAALLTAVFYAPIVWGQVAIAETTGAGQLSASAGQAISAALVFLALLAGLLARWIQRRPPVRLPNAVHLPAALFLVIASVSTVGSVNQHASKLELTRLLVGFVLFYLVANRPTLPPARANVVGAAFACSLVLTLVIPVPAEAGLALRMLTVIAVGIAVAVMVTQREDADLPAWLRNALVLSAALVVALYGWREKIEVARTLHDPTWQIFSTFFNPNPLGGFLAMIFPLAVSAAIIDRGLTRRLLWGFCALALAATIHPTRSKGAMVACAAAALLYLILLARQNERLRKLAVGVAIVGVIVVIGAGIVAWQDSAAQAAVSHLLHLDTPSNMFRMLTWKGTARMFEAYPWIGIGPGAFKYAFPKYAIAGYVEAAHENYLQVFAETGLVGGLSFLWLLGAVLFTGARAIAVAKDFAGRVWTIGGICAVVALMVHSLLDYDWYIGAINFSFWLVAGILASRSQQHPAAEPAPPVETAPFRRSRRRQPPAPPQPQPEIGRAFRWPDPSSKRTAFGVSWVALLALACIATWLCIEVPTRNALAQSCIETGDSYAMSGSSDAGAMALDQYDRARLVDPGWWEAWERHGLVLGRMEGVDAGVGAIERAHQLSRTNYRPWSSMGQLYEQDGRWNDAIRSYEQALTLFPNHTRTMRRLAEAYDHVGERDKALAQYRKLAAGENALYNRYAALSEIEVDTNFAYAHYELGREDQRTHDLGAALKHFDLTLRVIADYFARAQRTDQMFAALRRPREDRGPEMHTLEAKTRWRDAMVYKRVGMTTQEEEERTRALEILPDVGKLVAEEDAKEP